MSETYKNGINKVLGVTCEPPKKEDNMIIIICPECGCPIPIKIKEEKC